MRFGWQSKYSAASAGGSVGEVMVSVPYTDRWREEVCQLSCLDKAKQAVPLSTRMACVRMQAMPPCSSFDYENAVKRLATPNDWHKNIANAEDRKKAIKEMVKEARALIATWDAWVKRRKAAEALLDAIGCAKAHKDAKLSWGDDDDDDWGQP